MKCIEYGSISSTRAFSLRYCCCVRLITYGLFCLSSVQHCSERGPKSGEARQSAQHDADLMCRAVVDEWNIGAGGQRLAVQFGQRHSAGDPAWIVHRDVIERGVIPKADGVTGPGSRDAGIDAERRASHAETENPFHACAIEPARRTRVPRPSAAPDVWRLGIHVARNHIRLDFVTLHVRP